MNRSEAEALAAAVRAILKEDWDPIGFWTPADEYDAYVWRIVGLIIEEAPRERLDLYLKWAADIAIGAPVADAQRQAVVDRLWALARD